MRLRDINEARVVLAGQGLETEETARPNHTLVTLTEEDQRPDPGPEEIVIQASGDLGQFDVHPDGTRFLVFVEPRSRSVRCRT